MNPQQSEVIVHVSRPEELKNLVRKGGLEPPRYCYRQPLKLVRLPIPPLPQVVRGLTSRLVLALPERPEPSPVLQPEPRPARSDQQPEPPADLLPECPQERLAPEEARCC